jgi:hypothetical protein
MVSGGWMGSWRDRRLRICWRDKHQVSACLFCMDGFVTLTPPEMIRYECHQDRLFSIKIFLSNEEAKARLKRCKIIFLLYATISMLSINYLHRLFSVSKTDIQCYRDIIVAKHHLSNPHNTD